MLDVKEAAELAERFSLGDDAALSGPVARGEVGRVWKLSTSRGTFAVKEPFEPVPEVEVREHAAFQEAAHAAGILTPAVIRSVDGAVLADVRSSQARVFEWVDLRERDPDVDPAKVGRVVASMHCLRFPGRLPTDPWYTEPVGSERWDDLVTALRAERAPFADRVADLRDELVALESLMEEPVRLQTCRHIGEDACVRWLDPKESKDERDRQVARAKNSWRCRLRVSPSTKSWTR